MRISFQVLYAHYLLLPFYPVRQCESARLKRYCEEKRKRVTRDVPEQVTPVQLVPGSCSTVYVL